jgi:CDP-glucose 4,6-dehydratase
MLQHLGAEVFGISKDIGQQKPILRPDLMDENEFDVDIRDRYMLQNTIESIKPDLVFHLAAQSLVLESYQRPFETFEINFAGTLNVLNACTDLNQLSGVVIASTDKVYKNSESGRRFKEEDELGGTDPYSASKSCTSILVNSWRQIPANKEKQFVDVRAGNVIGGGDRAANRLMPDLINGALNDQPIFIRNPESVRPWQHVLDPLLGYLRVGESILERKHLESSYNFGPSSLDAIRVKDVADIFKQHFTSIKFEFEKSNIQEKESELLQLDSSLALNEFGWSSQIAAEEAVEMTISWETSVSNLEESPLDASKTQIRNYFEKIM